MSIVDEVPHLDGIKGNFMVSEIEYLVPATPHEETKLVTLIIYSSVKEVVEHQQYVFLPIETDKLPASSFIVNFNSVNLLPDNIQLHVGGRIHNWLTVRRV
jgi:hypothetical protein